MSETNNKISLPPISLAAPGPLYAQIVDGIKREVSEGRLTAGTALPSFRVLAEDLLVSVITVKRAYEELEREGIIYRRQGVGTFVADGADSRNRETRLKRSRDLILEAFKEGTGAGLSLNQFQALVQSVIQESQTPPL